MAAVMNDSTRTETVVALVTGCNISAEVLKQAVPGYKSGSLFRECRDRISIKKSDTIGDTSQPTTGSCQ